MRVVTLGSLGTGGESLPSSQATLALLRGEPGALWKVLGSMLLRAALVAPGVATAAYMAGARRGRLAWTTVAGSTVASAGISLFLLGHYWLEERRRLASTGPAMASPAASLPAGTTSAPPNVVADASFVASDTVSA